MIVHCKCNLREVIRALDEIVMSQLLTPHFNTIMTVRQVQIAIARLGAYIAFLSSVQALIATEGDRESRSRRIEACYLIAFYWRIISMCIL